MPSIIVIDCAIILTKIVETICYEETYKRYTKEHTKDMNWLEEKVQYALTYSAPKGFGVNPKVLRPISKRLIKTEGICPCSHDEWDENTPIEDKCCPCKTFRDTGECHCGLYVKLNIKSNECVD